SIGSQVCLIFQRRIFSSRFRLKWNMRVTLGPAELVENEITRNFQQPGREFCPRYIATRAFPHSNEYLLRDIFHVGIAAQHARHSAGDQSLVFLYQLLDRNGVASTAELLESHVVGVFF